jgi:hypothetical protein
MDPGDDFILRLGAIRVALSQRQDEYWELLATAAGVPESVARTEHGLCAEALSQGPRGPAIAPSLVMERVEALSAFSPDRLARLASEWVPPREIDDDPWWTTAWTAGLRHLDAVGAISRARAETPALAKECALIWGNPSPPEISWRLFAETLQTDLSRYDTCRLVGRARIIESTISDHDLRAVPWEMLRLLRGRITLLDPAARTLIHERARTWATRDPLEAALVAEICGDISSQDFDCIRQEVIDAIPSVSDARTLIPLAYVLLGSWHTP